MKKLEKLESFRMKLEEQTKITGGRIYGGGGTTYWSASECTNYNGGSQPSDAIQYQYADGTEPGSGEPIGHRMVDVSA